MTDVDCGLQVKRRRKKENLAQKRGAPQKLDYDATTKSARVGRRPLTRETLFGGDGRTDQRSGGVGFVDLHLVAEIAPAVESALQGAYAGDPLLFEKQRHTGAGGFVWSSTVEDDFTIVGKAIAVFL